ncbi:hypothetical protein trd_A0911 (plasmid) [Thermomicrobium roseum DSM 5159]|uniref:Uncharacterized protein n=1 Tax=Thermomicrobium roseum (strain ATCC 27502 / DSM 5159 / P-2) TaxID=309801 RepID=B9L547_THERP|nr:hypothetical protein trd_A0911 [Thermomicrobium roseum DSM 5159]
MRSLIWCCVGESVLSLPGVRRPTCGKVPGYRFRMKPVPG